MTTFQLNGTEVCNSFLTQRSFRAAYCELLVSVTPENQSQALEAFNKESKFSGLRVSGIAGLSFLAHSNLRYLEIVNQKRVNTRPLDGLSNLRGLRLETPGTGIDFSCFPELEVFVGDWHIDNSNVHCCEELRQLRVWHFKPRSLDLSDIANTTRLEWLQLAQTGIASLAGLETLEDLRYCEIAYAPKLESLDVLKSDRNEIRELSFAKAKKIASYESIAALRHLRRLKLSDCASMPNLKWTEGMDQLDFFSLVETNVEDGDLSPLLQLPKLRYVGTSNKKHYNYKSETLKEMLSPRAETGNRTSG
ncbi:MAG: hypothetical protein IAG10_12310 [Planctomycetaceae bacterium]|nr:hypothetical protein [Planctomycetaceae bacterium]